MPETLAAALVPIAEEGGRVEEPDINLSSDEAETPVKQPLTKTKRGRAPRQKSAIVVERRDAKAGSTRRSTRKSLEESTAQRERQESGSTTSTETLMSLVPKPPPGKFLDLVFINGFCLCSDVTRDTEGHPYLVGGRNFYFCMPLTYAGLAVGRKNFFWRLSKK